MLNTFGLTTEQVTAACPSVDATGKHESRSQRYLYIPTHELLAGLRKEGFIPTQALQMKTRSVEKGGYSKHLLRFRRIEDLGNVHTDVHEIVLVNSHDGTSSYKLMSGVFRFICTNGLIAGDINSSLNVAHRGNVLDSVIAATYQIVEESDHVMETITHTSDRQSKEPCDSSRHRQPRAVGCVCVECPWVDQGRRSLDRTGCFAS